MTEPRPFHWVDIRGSRYTRDSNPSECPVCHFAVHPDEIDWTLATRNDDAEAVLECVFECPRRECGHFFIVRYLRDDIPGASPLPGVIPGMHEFRFVESVPATPVHRSLPPEVVTVSPGFVEVFEQASAAEAYGLDQVAGVSLRKALEFLVKDYCISIQPEHSEAIRSAFLSNVISVYVDSPQVKIVAERAAWLGNDETHYERRWGEMDLQNLKELIQLTVNWIHSTLLTAKYQNDMQR